MIKKNLIDKIVIKIKNKFEILKNLWEYKYN